VGEWESALIQALNNAPLVKVLSFSM